MSFFTNWRGAAEPKGVDVSVSNWNTLWEHVGELARKPRGVQHFLHANFPCYNGEIGIEREQNEEWKWESVWVIHLIGKILFVTHSTAVALAALIASVRTLSSCLSTVDSSHTTHTNSDVNTHERKISHAAAVVPGRANYSVPRGIRGDTWDRWGGEPGDEWEGESRGWGVGSGRPWRSDVLITGPSNKTHFCFEARKITKDAVPPQIIGGRVINQQCKQD